MIQKIRQDILLCKNIRKYRRRKDLTQKQMVEKIKGLGIPITISRYSKIETGCNIKISEFAAICAILNIDADTLFQGLHLEKRSIDND